MFEELGPPNKALEGGFGLMNPQGIRKPAWFAYKYLHALHGNEVPVSDAETSAEADGDSESSLSAMPAASRRFSSAGVTSTIPIRDFANFSPGGLKELHDAQRVRVDHHALRIGDARTTWLDITHVPDVPQGLSKVDLFHKLDARTREVDAAAAIEEKFRRAAWQSAARPVFSRS